jgi:hypothetical protein
MPAMLYVGNKTTTNYGSAADMNRGCAFGKEMFAHPPNIGFLIGR